MAKARRIPDLTVDEPYATAAAKIVAVRAEELVQHADGVLDMGNVERVRHMRVASRRLRAALEIFGPCFARRERKAALAEVKAIADALGARRDHDVAIAALEDIAGSMAVPDRPGIETLIARLRSEQEAANEALAAVVGEERLASLQDRLVELVASAESPAEPDVPERAASAWLPRRETGAAEPPRLQAVSDPS